MHDHQENPLDEDHEEQLVAQFRQWLREAREEGARLADEAQDDDKFDDASADESAESAAESRDSDHAHACEHDSVGLYRLAEEFTSLRQEVKLQSRGARGLEEEIAKLLPFLQRSLEATKTWDERVSDSLQAVTRAVSQNSSTSNDSQTRLTQTLAAALADVDDALDRGRRQLERARASLEEPVSSDLTSQVDALFARQSAWARWQSRAFYEDVRKRIVETSAAAPPQALRDALVDGYALLQQRVQRWLEKAGITRIATVGHPVDLDKMVVVEAVTADPAGETRVGTVVDEIRRGYEWNGRLLRCAEVRAIRGT